VLRPEDDPLWDLKLPAGAGAFVETRTTFSKWDEPMAALTGLRNRIAVCGVATECCVLSTILGAVDHGRLRPSRLGRLRPALPKATYRRSESKR
jgi:hypothetical protein